MEPSIEKTLEAPRSLSRKNKIGLSIVALIVVICAVTGGILFGQSNNSKSSSSSSLTSSVTTNLRGKEPVANTKDDITEGAETEVEDVSGALPSNITAMKNDVDEPVDTSTKTEWPELVGKDPKEAEEIIKRERPDIKEVQILSNDMMMTMDYREDRVRIFYNRSGNVCSMPSVPRIG